MLAYPPALAWYCTFVMAVLGLCMGSFLNCLAWRMTHGESVLRGRSHCTSCGHVLGVRDLVPVLSWLWARGRCRYCGQRVSARYPATELLCGAAYVSILWMYGLSAQTIELVAFASVLLVLSLTDLDEYVIPNATIACALAIRVLYLLHVATSTHADALGLLWTSTLGGLVVAAPIALLALVMDGVLGRESLGGGDVKLFLVAGAYFGWRQCLFLVIVACLLGICLGRAVASRAEEADVRTKDGERAEDGDGAQPGGDSDADAKAQPDGGPQVGAGSPAIPFGPAIALACWACMLVGAPVVDWYFGLF